MSNKHSLDEVADALRRSKGMVSIAARRLGISRQAIQQRIQKSTTLQQVRDDAREEMKDTAEMRLYDKIEDGEAWAICFYLKTQAKDRGYVERTEVGNVPGEALTIGIKAIDYRTGLAALKPPEADADA